MWQCRWFAIALAIASLCGGWHLSPAVAADEPTTQPAMGTVGPGVPAFRVRPGYRVTIAVPHDQVEQARFITTDPQGTLYIS
jgi:hypothetical protein